MRRSPHRNPGRAVNVGGGTAGMAARVAALTVAAFAAAGCGEEPPAAAVQRANPASVNCVEQGGKLVIERPPAGEIGVCVFEDNRQCEEWALLRGQCPKGGIRIAGYATDEERYRAIRGER